MGEPKDEALGKSTIEGQVRAAIAACIANEIKNGRKPEVAKAMCYDMVRNKIGAQPVPKAGDSKA